jgi:hypothetical protein
VLIDALNQSIKQKGVDTIKVQFYKNRTLEIGQRVKVYFNLHNHLFSIVALEGVHKGKVVCHTEGLTLSNVTFKVNEAGRQRVLREKRKNVHAFVIGKFEGFSDKLANGIPITYNPYKYASFVILNNKQPITSCERVSMHNKKVNAIL